MTATARAARPTFMRIAMANMALAIPGLWREQIHVAAPLILANVAMALLVPPNLSGTLLFVSLPSILLYGFMIVRNGRLREVMPERPSFTAIALLVTLMSAPHIAFGTISPGESVNQLPFGGADLGLLTALIVRAMFLFGVLAPLIWGAVWLLIFSGLMVVGAAGINLALPEYRSLAASLFVAGTLAISLVALSIVPPLRRSHFGAVGIFLLIVAASIFVSSMLAGTLRLRAVHPLAPSLFMAVCSGLLVDVSAALLKIRPVFKTRPGDSQRKSKNMSKARSFRWSALSDSFAASAPGWWRECGHVFCAFFLLNCLLCVLNLAGLPLVFLQALILSFLILRGMRLREIERMSHRPTITGITVGLCMLALPYILIAIIFPFNAGAASALTEAGQPSGGLTEAQITARNAAFGAIASGIMVSAVFAAFIRSVTLFRLWPSIIALGVALFASWLGLLVATGALYGLAGAAWIVTACTVLGPPLLLVALSVRAGKRVRFSDLAGVTLLWGGVALMAAFGFWAASLLGVGDPNSLYFGSGVETRQAVAIIPFAAAMTITGCIIVDLLLTPLTYLRQLPHPR